MNVESGYAVYLLVSIAMTIWVARTLSSNGEVFLVKCFGQDEDLARSTNHLLVVGFYLINLGFIALRLGNWPVEPVALLPYVGSKIGVSLLTLGAKGMKLFGRGGELLVEQPAVAREVFDVSGAGDTVVAMFSLALAAGRPAGEAVELANRAAGLVIAKFGTATVTPAELLRDAAPERALVRRGADRLSARAGGAR